MVDEAIALRLTIESMPSNNVEDVDAQARLLNDCEHRIEFLNSSADMLIGTELNGGNPREKLGNRDHAAVQIGDFLRNGEAGEFRSVASSALGRRRTFHWPLEFPETVTKRGGFDCRRSSDNQI